MTKQELMSVGDLAKKMNVTVRTLQYYDKMGILTPAVKTSHGKRFYSNKEMVMLYQILSMKYLGFSLEEIKNNLIPLDTPEEVVAVLESQEVSIAEQIKKLKEISESIHLLKSEVVQMHEVDFSKYADILGMIQKNDMSYWTVKFLDESILNHVKEKYIDEPDKPKEIYERFEKLSDEIIGLIEKNIDPQGEVGQKIAKEWWDMVIDFTGGDMSLLPGLMKFEQSKENWSEQEKIKQLKVSDFIGKAFDVYFKTQNIQVPSIEGEKNE